MQHVAAQVKAHGHAKGKGKEKCSHKDDIPPNPRLEVTWQNKCLLELKLHVQCDLHSIPGTLGYCWIKQSGDDKGGHDPLSHKDLTIWAKHMVSMETLYSSRSTHQTPGHLDSNEGCMAKH